MRERIKAMKSSEDRKDGGRPSSETALEALNERIARLEAELKRRDREGGAEAAEEVYPAMLTLSAKLKAMHDRLSNLQKQSGDILESLGRRVDHLEADLRDADGGERLRQLEQKVQQLHSEAQGRLAALDATNTRLGPLETSLQQLANSVQQSQTDAQERLANLMATVTRLQNLSAEQNLHSDEIRRWFEPLRNLPNAVSDIRQIGAIRERLDKLEHGFGSAEGPENESVRQQLEACGGWPGALAAIGKFRELQDDLRQMRDERLLEQVVALGDQVAGLRHLADPHGGWEFVLNIVARLKEQLEMLDQLKAANVAGELPAALDTVRWLRNKVAWLQELHDMDIWKRLEECRGQSEQIRRDCDEALRRVESTDKGLREMVHLADSHGGWLHSLEALARSKEAHPFIEELRAIDIVRRVAALPYEMDDLARKGKQVADRLKEIEEGLEKMIHWADPHGGWEHTLQTTARFKENLEFLAKVRSIDFNALGDFFNTLKRENLVLRMKRLERLLRDLEKTYRVQEMLDKFKTEQRLLLE